MSAVERVAAAIRVEVLRQLPDTWLPIDEQDVCHEEGFDFSALAEAAVAACGYREPPPCDRCVDCGTELTRVFPDTANKQYANALEISLGGGYDMFFDNIDGDHHVFLCHDCAHLACGKLPWLNKLIQPGKSHAHTAEFWEFNNGHLGWDKPDKRAAK